MLVDLVTDRWHGQGRESAAGAAYRIHQSIVSQSMDLYDGDRPLEPYCSWNIVYNRPCRDLATLGFVRAILWIMPYK